MKQNSHAPIVLGRRTVWLTCMLVMGMAHAACGDDGNDPGDDAGVGTDGLVAQDAATGSDAGTGADSGPPDDGGADIGPAGQFTEMVVVDGVSRTYELVVPESAVADMQSGSVPLLIALHGAGGSGSNFIAATGLINTAGDNGFVLVGPEGFNAGWFVQAAEGWPQTDGNDNSLQNDAELLLTAIDDISASYNIDSNAIFLVGHSRGAGCVGLLAMYSGGMPIASGTWQTPFAAYGINAGYDATGGQVNLSMASPKVPVYIIHGTADPVVPFTNGESFANDLQAAGWDVTFTSIPSGGHTWLFDNQQLWSDFMAAARN